MLLAWRAEASQQPASGYALHQWLRHPHPAVLSGLAHSAFALIHLLIFVCHHALSAHQGVLSEDG